MSVYTYFLFVYFSRCVDCENVIKYTLILSFFSHFCATIFPGQTPVQPGRGHGSLICHMTLFERYVWMRSENSINIMIEYVINDPPLFPTQYWTCHQSGTVAISHALCLSLGLTSLLYDITMEHCRARKESPESVNSRQVWVAHPCNKNKGMGLFFIIKFEYRVLQHFIRRGRG